MGANFCSRCGHGAASGAAYCASCGAPLSTATAGAPALTYATAAPAASQAPYALPTAGVGAATKPPVTQGVAIAGLLLNILIWPGLGSLVAGENVGWAQGFLSLGGLLLILTLIGAIIGIPMMIAAWIWALVTGIQVVQRAT